MAKDGIWGDHLVLHAVANYFQTHIRIISSLDRDILISPEIPVVNTNPLVLGHIHELHYVSLQPKQGTLVSSTNIKIQNHPGISAMECVGCIVDLVGKDAFLGPDYVSQAGLVSRASIVCGDLGTPVKCNKNQLCDYMTTRPARLAGLKIFHVITFTRTAQLSGTTKKFA